LSGSLQGAGGVGGLLFANLGSATHAAAFDGNGNVIGYVDMATGEKSATYEYGAFGETLIADGVAAEAMPFRFSTKSLDVETGLYYYGYRYYSPIVGRWLSKDPLEEEGGENLYVFVLNDPISLVDPFGNAVNVPVIDPRIPSGYRDPVTGRAARDPGTVGRIEKRGKAFDKALRFAYDRFAESRRRAFIEQGRRSCEEQARRQGGCAQCCVINIYSVPSGPELENKVYYYSGSLLLRIPCEQAKRDRERVGVIQYVRPRLAQDETIYQDWKL
jgi:RHS repeat-associated protein